jgi:hypothetical protein
MDACSFCCLEYGGVVVHLDTHPIDGHVYHCMILPPRNAP